MTADSGQLPLGVDTRRAFRQLIALDVVFFIIFSLCAVAAPLGAWRNQIGYNRDWSSYDPGGIYVINALSIFGSSAAPPWDGHPGLTLSLPIAAAAKIIFAVVHGSGDEDTFFRFWAYKIRWLFVTAGVMMPLFHVASFHALYAFSRRLLGNVRAAVVSVFCYATLFTTLFYGARISPEPILVTTFLLTFLAAWKVGDALADRRCKQRTAIGWAAIGAVMAIAALYTKAHLAAPLALFVAVQLFLQRRTDGAARSGRLYVDVLLSFFIVAFGTFAFGMLEVDWVRFVHYWSDFVPGATTKPSPLNGQSSNMGFWGTLFNAIAFHAKMYRPTLNSHHGLFTLCESIFLAVAFIGTLRLLRRVASRQLLVWPIAYCVLLLPITAFRGSWHYMILHLAVLSPGAGLLLTDVAERLGRPALVWGMVAVLHGAGVVLILQSRVNDARIYRREFASYHRALERLDMGRTLIVITPVRPRIWTLTGADPNYMPWDSPFQHRFADLIYATTDPSIITREFVALRRAQLVLDLREDRNEIRQAKSYFKSETKEPQ